MNKKYFPWLVAAAALVVRLAAAIAFDHMSHPTDMNTFRFWAQALANDGFSTFYGADFFSDYPPGYMYVLAAMGWLAQAFGMEFGSIGHNILLKMPAMLVDVATVIFIYHIAMKFQGERDNKEIFAALVAMIYVLNPAVIINSAVWGQVDSVHTFLLVISIYLIAQRKMLPSVLIFAVSIVVKPQSFMLAPIYLFMFCKYVFGENSPKFDVRRFGRLALYGLACFVLIALMSMPFIDFSALPDRFIDLPIVKQYFDTFGTYSFVTHNAYNLYALLGLNHVDTGSTVFFGITYDALGFFLLGLVTVFSFFLLHKKNDTGSIFLVGAVLVLSTFVLSTRMHERYNFPAIPLLLLAYVTLRDKRMLYVYAGFSAFIFLNNIDVLMMSVANFNWAQIEQSTILFSIPIVALFVYFIYLTLTIFIRRPKISLPALPVKYRDVVICGAITLFYAVFAFTNLGNFNSPQSRFHGQPGEQVVIDFGEMRTVSRVQHMLGVRDNRTFTIEFSFDDEHWFPPIDITARDVFAWGYRDFAPGQTRFIRITPTSDNFFMQEMAFRDDNLNLLPLTVISATGHELFDEQHLVPLQTRDYMHSAYFDEIYHPRTAYEFIHGMNVFEWTHPPLGKVIMSWGIEIFGMTPFGWRFAGTLFGVLMLPLMYAFAKKIFNKSPNASFWAGIATFIFAFDFMHYAQTRLATIDTYVVFFIMGMYYFMYRYSQMNFFRDKLRKTMIPLLFSGIFTGLAIASKWQGAYGVIGIAVIFFWVLLQRYFEYDKSMRNRHNKRAKRDPVYGNFWKYTGITCAACVGFFIVIPLGIYLASYIPFWNTGYMHINRMVWVDYPNYDMSFLAAVWQNQVNMFDYHSTLVATHPYSSTWWQWIINFRPIWYFSNYLGGGLAQGISSFGNPLVWWAGFGAFIYCIYAVYKRRDKVAFFLVVAYMAQILPWIFVPRLAFIYHYFPNVPFIVLMLVHAFKESRLLGSKTAAQIFTNRKNAAVAFAVACFALFILFYPVLTGTPINRDFVDIYLRWFSSWQLI